MGEGGKEAWKRAGISKRDPAKAAREVGGNLDCRGTTPTGWTCPSREEGWPGGRVRDGLLRTVLGIQGGDAPGDHTWSGLMAPPVVLREH